MAYYGDPGTLKVLCKNIPSMTDEGTFTQQVEAWDALVTPIIEGHLNAVFSAWPAPNDKNQNAISTLWLLAMTLFIQKGKFATNTTGQQSAYGGDLGEAYTTLLTQIERGEIVIPGAVRLGMPTSSAYASQRWTISDDNQPDEPEGVGDAFPKGLRR